MVNILCLESWDGISKLCLEAILEQNYQQKAPNVKKKKWSRIDHSKSTLVYGMKIGRIILNYVACDKYKHFHLPFGSAHTYLSIDTQVLPRAASTGNVHVEALVSGVQMNFNDQANSQVQNLD